MSVEECSIGIFIVLPNYGMCQLFYVYIPDYFCDACELNLYVPTHTPHYFVHLVNVYPIRVPVQLNLQYIVAVFQLRQHLLRLPYLQLDSAVPVNFGNSAFRDCVLLNQLSRKTCSPFTFSAGHSVQHTPCQLRL